MKLRWNGNRLDEVLAGGFQKTSYLGSITEGRGSVWSCFRHGKQIAQASTREIAKERLESAIASERGLEAEHANVH